MAEQITLPAVGKVPKAAAVAAGALVVGIVGYAWWTKGAGGGDEEAPTWGEGYDEYGNLVAADPEYISQVKDSTITPEPGFGFKTNAEWFQFAIEYLGRLGIDQVAASAAIGKYLARQPLDPTERTYVRQALGVAGEPPQNGPYQILEAQGPGAATPLKAPTNLHGDPSDTTITWTWDPVEGATAYDVELVEGVSSVTERGTVTGVVWTPKRKLRPQHSYRVNVYAKNSAAQRGARATLVTRTTGAKALTKPTVRVVTSTRTSVHFRWTVVEGAEYYHVTGSGKGRTIRKRVPAREFVWQGLHPNAAYTLRVAPGRGESSGPVGTATGRTKR